MGKPVTIVAEVTRSKIPFLNPASCVKPEHHSLPRAELWQKFFIRPSFTFFGEPYTERERALLTEKTRKVLIGGALGEDIHVAGVYNFLSLAEKEGNFKPILLGPAISPKEFIGAINETDPDLIGVSYRLQPDAGRYHLETFRDALKEAGLLNKRYVFGGTPAIAAIAKEMGIFEKVFDGTEFIEEVISYIREEHVGELRKEVYPTNLIERIRWRTPFPMIRQHLGLTTLEETVEAARRVAEAKVIDVISIAPDQDAQENFFHPERQDPRARGAGGVPVRTPDDLRAIHEATRCGNFPLLRCYQGTSDLFRMAEMLLETIHNAWAAIPLFWFSQLDKRGPLGLEEAIREHQELMKWHAERNIPVELNEPHHFELRSAPDTVAVADEYLSAYNAKKMGVKHYIQTSMTNLPPGESLEMDLAKQLAKQEITRNLIDENFAIYRQSRTGLLSYPSNLDAAKGHMAVTVAHQMVLKPHIVHMVAFCEADHAATERDIIESARIVRHVLRLCMQGLPDPTKDPVVQERKNQLLSDAKQLIDAIRKIADQTVEDPLTDPETLGRAIRIGLLDAPQLKGSEIAKGQIETRIINGACYPIDPMTGKQLTAKDRLDRILKEYLQE
jgi:methylmalonyl-CoA mutase cobalamin-binding subunit